VKGGFSVGHHYVQACFGANQPSIRWAPGAISRMVKRMKRETDHWFPTSAGALPPFLQFLYDGSSLNENFHYVYCATHLKNA
jgi:hypothetical protein